MQAPVFYFAAGWCLVLLGLTTGALLGLRHEDDRWLGGYAAFPRRMVRLGHVALVALGALNVLFALSLPGLSLAAPWARVAGLALFSGGVLMPACCALAAWRRPLSLFFPLPVLALLLGAGLTTFGALAPLGALAS